MTVQKLRTANGASYVVKDSYAEKFFRLKEIEYFIITQCDGTTSRDTIKSRVEKKFGGVLSDDALQYFLERLEKNKLLETDETKKKEKKKNDRRIRGSLLYLRYKIFDPDHFFNRLLLRIRFCFTQSFVVISSTFIILAAAAVAANWSEFGDDLSRLYQLSTIPLFLTTFFFVVSLHEFAHGLTCKHFGGEVHEIGFMLIYFQPALYCNVSDAWLFPEKSKRLWVGFAGPYFELFLWALAVFIWRMTSTETIINHAALIVMTGSGIKTFLNFNPLIKLDGYYLLSDYLELPNLRRKSFRFVGDAIRRIFGFEIEEQDTISPRERKIYFFYGIAAVSGSFALLAYIFTAAGTEIIQSGPILAFFFFTIIGTRVRRRFRRMFGRSSDDDDFDDEGDTEERKQKRPNGPSNGKRTMQSIVSSFLDIAKKKKPSAEHHRTFVVNEEGIVKESEVNVPPPSSSTKKANGESKRERKKERAERRRILWLIAAGVMIAASFIVPIELRISGPFTILPIHNADVRAEIDGIIEEMYVTEGDQVKVGDVIARLSGRENRAELQKTEAMIRQARAKLQMQIAGPTQEEIALARTALEKAKEHLKYSEVRLERDKTLYSKDLLSQKEFENTQELFAMAGKEVEEAQGKLNVLLRGTRREEIEGTRAEILRLETERGFLEGQLQRLEVRSPAAGIVATPVRQLKEMERQVVQKGALIAKVYDMKKLTVEIPIPEKEIADVKINQHVAFKAQAYPNETFYGTVTSIATTVQGVSPATGSGTSTPSLPFVSTTNKTILVTTEIDNTSLLLKPGMSGQAKIYCGKRSVFDLVMRRLARIMKVEFWSWW
ncbi:MAG: HlyD family efflux transporter periplasmic adaptor subunit [Bacteroidota bacterium]